jgi:hypothetical protein
MREGHHRDFLSAQAKGIDSCREAHTIAFAETTLEHPGQITVGHEGASPCTAGTLGYSSNEVNLQGRKRDTMVISPDRGWCRLAQALPAVWTCRGDRRKRKSVIGDKTVQSTSVGRNR